MSLSRQASAVYESLLEAVREAFGNTSITPEETLEIMGDVMEEIRSSIDALKSDLPEAP